MKGDFKIILSTIVLLTALCFFETSRAINVSDFYDWSVDFFPEIPGPNTEVSAKLISYSFDVDRSNVVWILNNQIKLRGVGQKSFSFSTGNFGEKTDVSVLVTTEEGVQVRKDFSFRPADVDILWEALNYTPPTYKGKSLPVSESLIRVTAIPYFPEHSSNLIYEWLINYKRRPEFSGKGKNSFLFQSTEIYGANTIGLVISNYNQSVVAQESAEIKISSPKVIFYEVSPLEGPKYNNALMGDVQLERSEIIVRAEPYFFSAENLKEISYEWFMNEKKVFSDDFPNVLSLQRGGESGQSLINVKVNNSMNYFQYANNGLRIKY